MFETYPPKYNSSITGGEVLKDAAKHCSNWNYYKVPGSSTSSVHEATHGINADLRNGAIKLEMAPVEQVFSEEHPEVEKGTELHNLYVPDIDTVGGEYAAGYNAFYCLRDQAIKIAEPNCRKSDCIPFIPNSFRQSRFKLYVQGQSAWDGSPLYLFDEWTAYCNGAECAVVDGTGGKGTDVLFGPVEFVAYCTAILMAAYAKNHQLDSLLIEFSKWQIQRSFDLYNKGKDRYPWSTADKIYNQLISGDDGKSFRDFWRDQLKYIPNQITPDSEVDFFV